MMMVCEKFNDMLSRFDALHERNGRTDGISSTPHFNAARRAVKYIVNYMVQQMESK